MNCKKIAFPCYLRIVIQINGGGEYQSITKNEMKNYPYPNVCFFASLVLVHAPKPKV